MRYRYGIIGAGNVGGGGGGGGSPGTPSFLAVGTADGSIGDPHPTYPPGLILNDLMLLVIENGGSDAAIVVPGGGWASVLNSPVLDSATRLHVFWKRAAGGETGPISTIDNPDDHAAAQIAAFRNVKNSGNPWDVTASSAAGLNGTSLTWPTVTTTLANCMIVAIVSTNFGSDSTTQFSAWTNASLASITEGMDNTESNGNGGGFGMAYGIKVVAGLVSATTATQANSTRHAYMTIALAPAS